jgi:hypothetical protein
MDKPQQPHDFIGARVITRFDRKGTIHAIDPVGNPIVSFDNSPSTLRIDWNSIEILN